MIQNTLGYQVGRSTGVCAASGQPLTPGTVCIAALCERPEDDGLARLDYSETAWQDGARPKGLFSYWKTRVPEPQSGRTLFLDDDVLLNLLERLAGDERPQRVAFRFVLALILMRKRLVKYVGRTGEGVGEKWLLTLRGSPPEAPPLEVLNPHLGDQDVRQITDQLSEILQSEL